MSKKPSVNGTHRINLDNGYVVMRPMTIDDMLAFSEVESDFGAAIRAVKDGCLESKFTDGRELGQQPIATLTAILKGWNAREDEVALPPAQEPPSASPSTGR